MTVKIVTYRTLEPGPAFSVLGAVHGNERCGAEAIRRLIEDIDNGAVVLARGTLRLVPVTNPKAYAQGVRFVERNLNRYLFPKEEKRCYEDHLDPIVCGVLDATEVLLDLHSYTSQGGPFIFLDPKDPRETAFATALGVADFVCGWSDAFGVAQAGKESQGTTEYARARGAIAATLECGNHLNADAADIGYRAILRAMAHLGITDTAGPAAESGGGKRSVQMRSVYRREAGAELTKPWRHFDPVTKGEAMAKLADGRIIAAPEDGYIVLPKESADTGAEWFFFGTKATLPG